MERTIPIELHMVGCGGVFYHGISQMACWLKRRGTTVGCIHLYDPDSVEERNGLRQWGAHSGEYKVLVAGRILQALGVQQDITTLPYGAPPMSFDKDMQQVVVLLPDNHLTRVRVLGELRAHQEKMGWRYPALCITGGNTEVDGYAYSCMLKDEVIWCNWLLRHQDIREEAMKEAEEAALQEEEDTGCANAPGPDEQTVWGNVLTANCIWEIAERGVRDDDVGELRWSKKEGGVQAYYMITGRTRTCTEWFVEDARVEGSSEEENDTTLGKE